MWDFEDPDVEDRTGADAPEDGASIPRPPAPAAAPRAAPRTRIRTGTTRHASNLPLVPVTDAVVNAAPLEPTPGQLHQGDIRHDANTLLVLLRRPPPSGDMTRRRIRSAPGDVVTTGYAYGDGNCLLRARSGREGPSLCCGTGSE